MGLDIRLATRYSFTKEWTVRRHWNLFGVHACVFSYIYLSRHGFSLWTQNKQHKSSVDPDIPIKDRRI